MTQPTEYENLTYNAPDGAQMGKATTEKIAFYGSTPIVQPTTSSALVSTISSQSTSSGTGVGWSFPTKVDYENAVTAISTMQYALKQLGLTS